MYSILWMESNALQGMTPESWVESFEDLTPIYQCTPVWDWYMQWFEEMSYLPPSEPEPDTVDHTPIPLWLRAIPF